MSETLDQVIQFTSQLQQQDDVPLWSITSLKLNYALAMNESLPFGPMRKKLCRLMQWAYKIKLSDVLIFLVSLFVILKIRYQAKKNKTEYRTNCKRIFACCGCLSDEFLFKKYQSREDNLALRINWVTATGISGLKIPSIYTMVIKLFRLSIGHSRKLINAKYQISQNILAYLTTSAINIGEYVFYLEYFKKVKKSGVNELAILAPSVTAFAAIDAGIKTIFMQHGLVELDVLIPKFYRIEALTADEVCHFRNILKNTIIYQCYDNEYKEVQCDPQMVMWLSVNFVNELIGEYSSKWYEIDEWAKKNNLKVVIRPTPKVTHEQLKDLQKKFPHAIIDDLKDTLEACMQKWKPKFVIGWRSTGLATALQYGFLPIILHPLNTYSYTWNLVYPFRKRVLFWDRDAETIDSALNSQENFSQQVSKLREQI